MISFLPFGLGFIACFSIYQKSMLAELNSMPR